MTTVSVIERQPVGRRPIELHRSIATRDEALELSRDTGAVFFIQSVEIDLETGQARVRLHPGRGVVYLFATPDPEDPRPMTAANLRQTVDYAATPQHPELAPTCPDCLKIRREWTEHTQQLRALKVELEAIEAALKAEVLHPEYSAALETLRRRAHYELQRATASPPPYQRPPRFELVTVQEEDNPADIEGAKGAHWVARRLSDDSVVTWEPVEKSGVSEPAEALQRLYNLAEIVDAQTTIEGRLVAAVLA